MPPAVAEKIPSSVHPGAPEIEPVRRVAAEALGTAILLMAVAGSGIMGDRLAGGNVALALLANTIATGAAPVVLISISKRAP
jgi:glycerol uptake facilitator-like aquaporin